MQLFWSAVVVYVLGVVITAAPFLRHLRAHREPVDIALAPVVILAWPIARPVLWWIERQDAAEARRQGIGEHYVPEPMPMATRTECSYAARRTQVSQSQ